ncbi:MAG: hypothetical protein IKH52_06255 [Bacteroidaceae bacterium]|nr:hypothetical protein [Bacteroidaceae bacterium]
MKNRRDWELEYPRWGYKYRYKRVCKLLEGHVEQMYKPRFARLQGKRGRLRSQHLCFAKIGGGSAVKSKNFVFCFSLLSPCTIFAAK